MEKFEKINEQFYQILNNSANKDIKIKELKRLCYPLISEYKINLLNDLFKELFTSKQEKLNNREETLSIIEELNESLKLYDIVNKTPNAAYDLLIYQHQSEKHCSLGR